MKKFLFTSVIAVAALFSAATVNAQFFHLNVVIGTPRQAFYYYPSANVYLNLSTHHYIYDRGGVWVTVNNLPFLLGDDQPRFMVYHDGDDVWEDNRIHENEYARGRYDNRYGGYGGYPEQDGRRNDYRGDNRGGDHYSYRGYDRNNDGNYAEHNYRNNRGNDRGDHGREHHDRD